MHTHRRERAYYFDCGIDYAAHKLATTPPSGSNGFNLENEVGEHQQFFVVNASRRAIIFQGVVGGESRANRLSPGERILLTRHEVLHCTELRRFLTAGTLGLAPVQNQSPQS